MADKELPKKLDVPHKAPTEIVKMAEEVRKAHHRERLTGARIHYVLMAGNPKFKGCVVLGRAKKVGEVEKTVLGVDFIVCLNWHQWQQMTDDRRRALLDHELSHCASNDRGGWRCRPHDVEDFVKVIERRGLWNPSLRNAGGVIAEKQRLLFEVVDRKTAAVVE